MAAKPRMLVVDDDARYRRVLTHVLAPLAEVEFCADGAAALELVARQHFDWVLLDVGLPDMDGFEVLAGIRRRNTATRVLLHSGLAIPGGRRRAREGGAVDLLEKPLSLPQLAALLAS